MKKLVLATGFLALFASAQSFACPTVIAPSIQITVNGKISGLQTTLTDESNGQDLELDNVEGNLFSSALKAGTYLVTLSRDEKVLASQKIVLKNAGCHSTFVQATFDCGIESGSAVCRAYE